MIDKESLKAIIIELFESKELQIFVEKTWSEFDGDGHKVEVYIDSRRIYEERC